MVCRPGGSEQKRHGESARCVASLDSSPVITQERVIGSLRSSIAAFLSEALAAS